MKPPPSSATTAAATAFVDAHLGLARELGGRLAGVIDDPDAFVALAASGFASLADPSYADGQRRVAPGLGAVHGVRSALLDAVGSTLARELRGVSAARLLFVADRLARDETLEARLLEIDLLDRILPADPERAWQLLRGVARRATDWITVDDLARPYARGVLLEPYRWAELEQLVYSPSCWERRLVGSTVARLPFLDHRAGRRPDVARRGLDLVGRLIGDADPDVQKALSWALRSLTLVDLGAVAGFCRSEADRAAALNDGYRAWVLRDTLAKLDPVEAQRISDALAGVRRRPGAPSTSEAAATAARFGPLAPPDSFPEPPLA